MPPQQRRTRPANFTQKDGVTLRDYVDTRLESIEKAIDLAAATLAHRLDSMNEIREQLRDQAGTFATREQVELQVSRLDAAIDSLQAFQHRAEGKASMSAVYIGYAIAAAGIVLGIIGLLT